MERTVLGAPQPNRRTGGCTDFGAGDGLSSTGKSVPDHLLCLYPRQRDRRSSGAPKYCVFQGNKYEVTELKGEISYYCRNQPEGQRMGADAKTV